jgi:hypothetical protein
MARERSRRTVHDAATSPNKKRAGSTGGATAGIGGALTVRDVAEMLHASWSLEPQQEQGQLC